MLVFLYSPVLLAVSIRSAQAERREVKVDVRHPQVVQVDAAHLQLAVRFRNRRRGSNTTDFNSDMARFC